MRVSLRGGDSRVSTVGSLLVQKEISEPQSRNTEEALAEPQLINDRGQAIARYRTEINESNQPLAEVIRKAEETAWGLKKETIIAGAARGALGGGVVGLVFSGGATYCSGGVGVLVGRGWGAAYEDIVGEGDSLRSIIDQLKPKILINMRKGDNYVSDSHNS